MRRRALSEADADFKTRESENSAEGKPLLDICPAARFEEVLGKLLKPELLLNATGTREAPHVFSGMRARCGPTGGPQWPISHKRLIINLGIGTTGTRWLNEVMRDLGFDTAHFQWIDTTQGWEKYEYISDTPISRQHWDLIHAFPDATFLLSVRDGVEWRDSRQKHHRQVVWMPAPCGRFNFGRKPRRGAKSHKASPWEVAPAVMQAYNAWIACLLPESQLFTFNLFRLDKRTFLQQLVSFLEARGFAKPSFRDKALLGQLANRTH